MGSPPDVVDLLDRVYEATTGTVTDLDDVGFASGTGTAAWTVRELLFHQLCDSQRALIALTTRPPGPVDTDAVTYWSAWTPGTPGADAHARYVRRAAAAYRRPASLVAQWTETSRAAVRAARLVLAHDPTARVSTQGHVLTAPDLVHTLVVEAVVHHLDLTVEVPSPGLPEAAYRPVLDVLTGLLGADLPVGWGATEAIRKGTGRMPLDDTDRAALGGAARRIPLFG